MREQPRTSIATISGPMILSPPARRSRTESFDFAGPPNSLRVKTSSRRRSSQGSPRAGRYVTQNLASIPMRPLHDVTTTSPSTSSQSNCSLNTEAPYSHRRMPSSNVVRNGSSGASSSYCESVADSGKDLITRRQSRPKTMPASRDCDSNISMDATSLESGAFL